MKHPSAVVNNTEGSSFADWYFLCVSSTYNIYWDIQYNTIQYNTIQYVTISSVHIFYQFKISNECIFLFMTLNYTVHNSLLKKKSEELKQYIISHQADIRLDGLFWQNAQNAIS